MKASCFFYVTIIVCIFTYVSCLGQTPPKTSSDVAGKDSLVPNNNLDNKTWRLRLEKFALREGLVRPKNQDTSTWFAVLEQFADPRFDSIAKQLKGKPYIQYHRLKNSYVSFSGSGQMIPMDWDSVVNNKYLTSFRLSNPIEDTKSLQGLYSIYQLNQDYNKTSKALEKIGIKAPMGKVKKAALLGLNYEHGLVNPTGFLAHQSEYVYTLLHIWMIDTATFLQKDIPYGTYEHTIFDAWLIKIYTPNGKLLLNYQTKESIRPGYLLQISNDERFILMGTVYNIGDDESYEPKGPFVLYDDNSKNTYILPAIDPNDKQKYPDGIGELSESKFISSVFQLTSS